MAGILVTFIKNALGHASYVWVELTFACIAAGFYFAFAGATRKAGSKMKASSGSLKRDQSKGVEVEQALTPVQLATNALRRGKIVEAIDIINELPEVEAGNVPDGLAQGLLMVTTKVPRSAQINYKLIVLRG